MDHNLDNISHLIFSVFGFNFDLEMTNSNLTPLEDSNIQDNKDKILNTSNATVKDLLSNAYCCSNTVSHN